MEEERAEEGRAKAFEGPDYTSSFVLPKIKRQGWDGVGCCAGCMGLLQQFGSFIFTICQCRWHHGINITDYNVT